MLSSRSSRRVAKVARARLLQLKKRPPVRRQKLTMLKLPIKARLKLQIVPKKMNLQTKR